MPSHKSDPTCPEFHDFVLGCFIDRLKEAWDQGYLDVLHDIKFGKVVHHHNATLYPVTVAGRNFTLLLLDGEPVKSND